jgi:hypothetical protein
MDNQLDDEVNMRNSDNVDKDPELGGHASESDDGDKDPAKIKHLTEHCLSLFGDCQRHPALAESDWIDKMAADFNWWSLSIGATKSGHSSLDYRVRTRDDVRSLLVNLLESLVVSLQKCIDIGTLDPASLLTNFGQSIRS